MLLSGGCALLHPLAGVPAPANRAHLEKLVAGQHFHLALQYLPELSSTMEKTAFENERRRLLALISELETATETRAAELRDQNEPAAALRIVDQALKKIPQSAILLELSKNISQELAHRGKRVEWQLLASRADYLLAQFHARQELDRLSPPSWFGRRRLTGMAEALDALGPELLDCGRQALAASEKEIAGQCLRMARDIDETADVADLLARVEDRGPPPEPAPVPAPVAESALVPITATKKIRPGMAADTPSLPDLENLLQQEIAGGEIIKGYATLAILKKLPNAAESWRDYKARLDQARKRLVAGYLEKGADLYRDGMIAEARETWQQVLELEPDNALALEKIARADRVLNKLLSLQKAQQKKPPAR